MFALPARSPIPLIVPWIQRRARADGGDGGRGREPEVVVAVEVDRDVRAERLARPADERRRPPRASRRRACRRRRPRCAPASTAAAVDAARRSPGSARVPSTPKNATVIPSLAANETASRDPAEHRLARDAERVELQVARSATRSPSRGRRARRAPRRRPATAREKPQTSASSPASAISRTALAVLVRDAREAGLDPLDARARRERARDLELLLRRRARRRRSARRRAASCRRGRRSRRRSAYGVVELAGPDRPIAHAEVVRVRSRASRRRPR